MSADNWAICPRCLDNALATHAAEVAAVMSTYGTVPVEEFDKRRAELEPVNPEDHRTFREDYEFYGAEEGTVVASYGGACSKCGLTAEINESRTFYTRSEAPDA